MQQEDAGARRELIRKWLKENVSPDQQMSMIENPPPADRLELVKVWLEENVLVPPTPQEITISEIEFDWEHLEGSFRLALDNLAIRDPFDLYIDVAGRIQFRPPMFYSPLGAPASYSAVRLDTVTSGAIDKALESVFPRLLGHGMHKDLGVEIHGYSPLRDRIINRAQFTEKVKRLHTEGFRITMSVGHEPKGGPGEQ
jgi:hypothetical protein